mmetsp:Transcript_104834/g.163464  ORF Transcript_104834/g.163464 Transcript_104834/m.163464 type:complete len:80 (+) Transcript_104834:29-268(+)
MRASDQSSVAVKRNATANRDAKKSYIHDSKGSLLLGLHPEKAIVRQGIACLDAVNVRPSLHQGFVFNRRLSEAAISYTC